jgi:hypothetical protein
MHLADRARSDHKCHSAQRPELPSHPCLPAGHKRQATDARLDRRAFPCPCWFLSAGSDCTLLSQHWEAASGSVYLLDTHNSKMSDGPSSRQHPPLSVWALKQSVRPKVKHCCGFAQHDMHSMLAIGPSARSPSTSESERVPLVDSDRQPLCYLTPTP